MGGAPALPTPSTPGYAAYKDFYGRTWTACYCLAQWLKAYERLLLAHGEIKQCIDIWQLTGGAADSAGTHTQGGVFDLLFPLSDKAVALGREMGAPPLWRRPAPPFKKPHLHGVLNGCAHNDPARYQVAAQKAGYDGLGSDGRLHKDPHPDPKVYRTWREGIAWADAETKRLTTKPAPAPTTTPQEDTVTPEQMKQILDAIDAVPGRVLSQPVKHPTLEGQTWALKDAVWSTNVYAFQGAGQVDADVIADAVLAKLPADGLSADKVRAAVREVFADAGQEG